MKLITKVTFALLLIMTSLLSCKKFLDRESETSYKEEEVFVNYERMSQAGYGVYNFILSRFGWHRISGGLLASATDEADHADPASTVQRFNAGTWNAAFNPEDYWGQFYQGVRRANIFLEQSTAYKTILYRDTIDPTNKATYEYNVRDIEWLRAEVRFLRAFYYFELIKRYGGVPLILKPMEEQAELLAIKRSTFDECVQFIETELDVVVPQLRDTWVGFDSEKWRGRATKGAAMALKSRLLLYAASPLHNPSNDLEKWRKAAKAAHDVIALNRYSLHSNYKDLFRLGHGADGNTEVIFAQNNAASNSLERYNYPIGYQLGGDGSTSPSQNLVDAYEMKSTGLPINEPGSGYNPAHPYVGRDPRLGMSVLTAFRDSSILKYATIFKNDTLEAWVGGKDGLGRQRATTTGYYMRKFIDEALDLTKNEVSVHTWLLFRHGEILLNFAEAMNEAYGPETTAGYTLSAKKAIDQIRDRAGVKMPPLPPGLSQTEMRERIRNERRVELAFEEHRFFDVRRWKIAEQTENKPIMAMKIMKNPNGTFGHTVVKAEDRAFSQKMYLYPIPEVEVLKSNGGLLQNPGW